MNLVFTIHAEDQVKALKGKPDASDVINLLNMLETGSKALKIRNVTQPITGSGTVKMKEVGLGQWRVIFTEDETTDKLIILSVQKAGPYVDFRDVWSSVVTEVTSTGTTDSALNVTPKKKKQENKED